MIRHDREVGDNVSGCAFDVLHTGLDLFFLNMSRGCVQSKTGGRRRSLSWA